ncbi:MAG: hypothetical protein L0215_12090 [Gemmataceae bacterium]|nr:hypothetical protein [Gemmataceae bacterium]
MSRRTGVLILAAAGVMTALWFGWFNPSGADPQDGPSRQIPIQMVFSTNGQDGLQPPLTGFDASAAAYFSKLMQRPLGASNVFLVRANNIESALRATFFVSHAGQSADTIATPDDDKKHEGVWLVAYLGVQGSDPPGWLIHSVEQRGNTIRFSYLKRVALTRDIHCYYFWVSIGELNPGDYVLELFDAEKKCSTLTRLVHVNRQGSN